MSDITDSLFRGLLPLTKEESKPLTEAVMRGKNRHMFNINMPISKHGQLFTILSGREGLAMIFPPRTTMNEIHDSPLWDTRGRHYLDPYLSLLDGGTAR